MAGCWNSRCRENLKESEAEEIVLSVRPGAVLTVGAAEKEPVDYVNASDYARRRLTVLVK